MIRQIRLLTKVQICNLFSINEFRFTKDKKKKFTLFALGLVWLLLIGYVIMYAGGLSFGLCMLDMGRLVPAVLSMSVALLSFMFTIFKAGAVIFNKKSYDIQMPLPVSTTAVVISRFLTMYVTNLGLSLLVMVPGILVCGYMEKPDVFFYLYGIIGACILPLLPLTAATILGAGIVGIAARWKRKNLVEIVLTMAFILVVFLGSFSMSGIEDRDINSLLLNMAQAMEGQIRKVYPPALWLANAMTQKEHLQMLLFAGISVLLFGLFVFVLQKNYVKVSSLINAHSASKAYEMGTLQRKSILRSLWEREMRHYFSSSIYVTNTMVGYLLMVVTSFVILVWGITEMEKALGVSGVLLRVLPVVLGMMPGLMPTTASSISIEGKEWWIAQTLPISMRELVTSKILTNITVAMPFYVVSEILVLIAVKPKGMEFLWLLLIPALYIWLSAVSGIAINLKLPVFNWESEVYVIKQSAATFVSMLAGLVFGAVPLVLLIVCRNISINVLYTCITLGLLLLVAVCYGICRKAKTMDK